MKRKKAWPIDRCMQKIERTGWSATFSDVLLKSGYTTVPRSQVLLETKFSRNIALGNPISSAAMDTVTESAMAIALAKLGCIGVIHKGMPAEKQASEVERVKFELLPRIPKPVTARENEKISAILQRLREKRWKFHSLPVVGANGKLAGLLTKNDFDLCADHSLTASQVMRHKVVTGTDRTTMRQALALMQKHRIKILPLVDRNDFLCGMYVHSDIDRILTGSSSQFNLDAEGRLRVAAAIGTDSDDLDRALELYKVGVDAFVIDKAHADFPGVYRLLKTLKRRCPDRDIAVGNIAEPGSCRRLISAGADAVKVGLGPGSICTTRVISGAGAPQVTAVYNCSKVARGSRVPIIADGGIVYSGDITVILGAGASSVMLGGVLAGTAETPGDIITRRGAQVKLYRGMGSLGAMNASRAARDRYDQASASAADLIPEGVESVVPYKGPVAAKLQQLLGGLRAGMSYVGAATIQELHHKANYHFITQGGVKEGHVHDVDMIDTPQNYHPGGGR